MKPDFKTPKPAAAAAAATISKAIKRERPASSDEELDRKKRVEPVNEIESKIKALPLAETEAVENTVADEYADDMDFSMLEDDENQFSEDVVAEKKVTAVPPKPTLAAPAPPKPLKSDADNFQSVLSNWENICNTNDGKADADDDLLSAVDVGESISQATGAKEIKFWLWDAWEDPIKFPGKVYLFGKTPSEQNPQEFRSVCITIENVDRCLYVLPRKQVRSAGDFCSTLHSRNKFGTFITFTDV